MFVGESGNLYIEKAHPVYSHVIDFLVSCCEPVSRTHHMEQYRLDNSSLSAATAEGTYTCDMIRNILRYFCLDEKGEVALDLQKLEHLEAWASSPPWVAVGGNDLDCGPGAEVSGGSTKQPICDLGYLKDADWDLRRCYWKLFPECYGTSSCSGPAREPLPHAEGVLESSRNDAAAAEQDLDGLGLVKSEGVGPAGPSTSLLALHDLPSAKPHLRVLSLKGGRMGANGKSGGGRDVRQLTTGGEAVRLPAIFSTTEPLVAFAVRQPEKWSPQPLPAIIEAMLVEEESASKMRIVLQPRLRRFANRTTATQRSASAGADLSGGGALSEEEEELFYFIVSSDRQQLEMVVGELKDYIEPAALHGTMRWVLSDVERGMEEEGVAESGRSAMLRRLFSSVVPTTAGANRKHHGSPTRVPSRLIYKSQIKQGKLREVKERLFRSFGVRADCYYDYVQDRTLHVDHLTFASQARLRSYQVASLERFCRGQRAHQGVVVLPCGAGKTLTGIGAAVSMQKRTIVMCVNNMSVFQWQREFLRWTNLSEEDVTVCTAKLKQKPGRVFITTYSMLIAKRGKSTGLTAKESEEIIDAVESSTWGLLLLDEVHTALAHHFQEVLNKIKYKCVLGLSATLLREDDRIANLRHLVGPKLYEANWLDLTRSGFLATVECAEVRCPLPASFVQAYAPEASGKGLPWDDDHGVGEGGRLNDEGTPSRKRRRHVFSFAQNIAACNPYKLWCTQALLEFHRNRSPPDKIIIFCDYLDAVRYYANHLHLPFMDRKTSESERENLLQYFQHSDQVNAIILTRVGDVALDLPCASVIIQISGLGASRRQEAQRLGRILRPKPPSLDNTCSYFYSLVSQDTSEVRMSYDRQSWLRDQGFAYRVLHCDLVFREFDRVGGVRCCIGPPQWWYQVSKEEGSASSTGGAADLRCRASVSSASASSTSWVLHAGQWWVSFSPAASWQIQKAFSYGRDDCILGESAVGVPSHKSVSYAVIPEAGWRVCFSSADAPNTFGIVTIAGAAGEGMRGQEVERRITFGQLQQPHVCLRGPCETYALEQLVGGRRDS